MRGVVDAPAFHFPEYTVLALADGPGGGALELPHSDSRLDSLHPGDEIEATGTVAMLAGMVVIQPSSVTTVGPSQSARGARSHPSRSSRA